MIDFDQIRRDYPLPDVASASGLALKKNGNEYLASCPFHSEKTESFSIYRDKSGTWKFHCFGCGAHDDVIGFYKDRYGCKDAGEAAREITGGEAKRTPIAPAPVMTESADPYAGYDIGRPPKKEPPFKPGAKTPPLLNPKRLDPNTGKPKSVTYRPTMVFPYRTRKGDLIGYVLRVEFDDKKITPGVWWTKNAAAGFEGWSHGSYPAPRPLYGLEELDAHPDWQIMLVEGEKCKDAAARLLKAHKIIPMTWMGGGKSISKVHWKSLAGRSVVIWPDNDDEGWKTTRGWAGNALDWHKGIVEYLFEAGVKSVKIVTITQTSRPKGWDIADAEAEGLGPKGVELIIRDRIELWTETRFADWKAKQIAAAGPQGTADQRIDRLATDLKERIDDDDKVVASERILAGASGDVASKVPRDGRPPVDSHDDEPDDRASSALVGRGFQIDGETWRQHLIMKADGEGLKGNSLQNFALLLQYEARFAGIFAWNEFAKEVYLQRRPPWDVTPGRWKVRKMTDPDVTSTACWLEYCGMSPKTGDIGKIIQRVAQHNSYNPVIDALTRLKWDGVQRLSGADDVPPWLSFYMGAADTTENRAFGRKWMIGAVARAMQPGCKLDTMLVLEGPQGLKKSTALRILSDAVAPGVFTDEMSDPNSKDAGMQMQGAWIIEVAELDALRRAEVTQIKSWLSRQTDRFRRPYGKIVEEFPRACVFAGTVNPVGVGYLKDASGGRRFWPVAVSSIDLDLLRKDAPQLWAEALAAYREGEPWWLDDDEQAYATIAQEQRYEEDPFGQIIDGYTNGRTRVTTADIMQHALEIPIHQRNTVALRRVAAHLHAKGWERINDGGTVIYERNEKERLV